MALKFGIVGCGQIGHRHAKHISEHEDAELLAGYDIIQEQSQSIQEKFGARACTSYKEMLNIPDIDIICICTPNGIHHTGVIQAVRAGKHALVEKPMSVSVVFCKMMIDAAQQAGREIFVVKQNRYNPPVQALHRLIQEDRLGNIYMVDLNCFWNRNEQYYINSDWKGTKELDGGTLFTQFSHFVDILYYLLGDISEVIGFTRNASHTDLIEFEDSGVFSFRMQSGIIGNLSYTTSAYNENMEGSITLFAENGTIKVGGKYLNVIDYQNTNGLNIEDLPSSSAANSYGYYEGSMSNHDQVINNVVQTLTGKGKIMTNAEQGMKVVEIIEKFYAAAKKNS